MTVSSDLTDRLFVVTGASSRLGAHFAEVLSQAGARVALGDKEMAIYLDEAEITRLEHHLAEAFGVQRVQEQAQEMLSGGHYRVEPIT